MGRPRRLLPRALALLSASAACRRAAAAETTTAGAETGTEVDCINRLRDGTVGSGAEEWQDDPGGEGGLTCGWFERGESEGKTYCSSYGDRDYGYGSAAYHCCICGGGCPLEGCPTETATPTTLTTTTRYFATLASGARGASRACGWSAAAAALLLAAAAGPPPPGR